VIILAGGLSKRFGENKCLKELAGKALVVHVLDRVANIADEKLIVVGSEAQQKVFSRLPGLEAKVIVDKYKDNNTPLIGALTGFETVQAELALLLPCDAVFVSSEVASLLLDLCVGRSAAIPRWPNGYIEPLQAVYNVKLAAEAARMALSEGKYAMSGMISHLRLVRYVSTLVLQQYDKQRTTLFNINTVEDWKRAESMLRHARK
jgi:molybdopterin-guanine dinucleotide biosynthesis protein A